MPVVRALPLALPAIFLLALSAPANAELGDYSFWQSLSNLVSPPRADNPVTPAQRVGPYPLLANPAGFNSGFDPGNYYGW